MKDYKDALRAWCSIELWEGYVLEQLTLWLKKHDISYYTSDCTPLPRENKFMIRVSVLADDEQKAELNRLLDDWFIIQDVLEGMENAEEVMK